MNPTGALQPERGGTLVLRSFRHGIMRLAAGLAFVTASLLLPATPAGAREVRIATYNIEGGTGVIGSDKYEAIFAILERIDADIICFQELRTTTYAEWLALAQDLGYPFAAMGGNGPFSGHLYNGYFSRFPIMETRDVVSPPGAVELSRFPFRAVVDVPDAQHPLVLWTMHHKVGSDSADKFRRAIEAHRIAQDMETYLAANPAHAEYVLAGDMNDDTRFPQTPLQFNAIPITQAMPASFVLGDDIPFPVPYAIFPTDHYSGAGQGLVHMPAFWEGTETPITRPAASRKIDYVFLSPALAESPHGAPRSEVYYTETDMGGGLPKAGAPLPFDLSLTASDHLPIFVDVHMAPFDSVMPTTGLDISGEFGGPFDPITAIYVVTNKSSLPASYSVSTGHAWISASPADWALQPGGSIEVEVVIHTHGLAAGLHSSSVVFSNQTTGWSGERCVRATIGGMTAKGVPMDWYARFGLEPALGETWDDLDDKPSAAGAPNWTQYLAGLDPTDPAAVFEIRAVNRDPGMAATVQWLGGTNGPARDYILESAPAPGGPWTAAGSVPRQPGLHAWTDEFSDGERRFYRVLAAPSHAPSNRHPPNKPNQRRVHNRKPKPASPAFP